VSDGQRESDATKPSWKEQAGRGWTDLRDELFEEKNVEKVGSRPPAILLGADIQQPVNVETRIQNIKQRSGEPAT